MIKRHFTKAKYIFAIVVFISNIGDAIAQEDSSVTYFPNKYLLDTINTYGGKKDSMFYSKREKISTFTNNWYSKHLMELNEPILHDDRDNESYRFTWYGTFGTDHNPLSVRIENRDGNILLIAKYVKSANYNRRKHIFKDIDLIADTLFVEQKEWKIFKDKLNKIDFWEISPIEIIKYPTNDGSIWIFEGNDNGIYHMVHRHVKTKTSEIGDICMYLLKLSKIPIKEKWFY